MKKKTPYFILILAANSLFLPGCKKDEKPTGPITDSDGNSYKTVKIGTQVWMAENLKTTTYNDGTDIPLVEDADAWYNLTAGGYCWYNNDAASFKDTYGALYNGYTIATGKLCPTGWHVPEKDEWMEMREFLGDSATAGDKLKEVGTVHWHSPNKGAVNTSGFTALPAGIRYFEGTFASITTYTGIWSATGLYQDDEWFTGLYYGEAGFTIDSKNKKYGFSVRCLKN